jgi:hypothetical protein
MEVTRILGIAGLAGNSAAYADCGHATASSYVTPLHASMILILSVRLAQAQFGKI